MIKENKIKLIRYFGMIFVVTLSLGVVTFFKNSFSAGLRTSEFTIMAPLEKVTQVEEIIVKLKSGNEQTVASAASVGAGSVEKTEIPGVFLVDLPKGGSANDLVQKIELSGSVEYAEPNYRAWIGADEEGSVLNPEEGTGEEGTGDKATGDETQTDTQKETEATTKSNAPEEKRTTEGPKITDDPLSTNQWGLTVMKAPTAWKNTTGSQSLKVAVIDSGVDTDHPDFSNANFVQGKSLVKGKEFFEDDHGHGTHVSGLVAATTNNNIGIAGLAWNTSIMPIKVTDRRGVTDNAKIAEGISYAVNNGADLINISLYGNEGTRTLYNTIDYAVRRKGVTVIASSGTGANQKVGFPAAYPEVIAVSSIDQDLKAAFFARQGSEIDITAPGQDVVGPIPYESVIAPTNVSGYGTFNGTSMATGYTSGSAALLLSYDPSLTPAQVYKRLASSATKVDAMGGVSKTSGFGYGIVNPSYALTFDNVGPKFEAKPTEKTVSIEVAGTISDDTNDRKVIEYTDVSDSNIATVQYRYDQKGSWQSFGGKMSALSPAKISLNIMKPAVLGDHTLEVRAQDTSTNFSNKITFKFNVSQAELAAIQAAQQQNSAQVDSEGYVPSSDFLEELNKMRALQGLPPLTDTDFRESTTEGVKYDYVTPFKTGEGYRPKDEVNPFSASGGFGF
ncbi:S8 family serine peptidase [Patescibacteria group bacterium]